MPAYVWITALAAVAFIGFVALGRRWWRVKWLLDWLLLFSPRRWWYSWRHAAHVIELGGTEREVAPEYGSMVLAEEKPLGWLPAPPVDPDPWLTRKVPELACAGDHGGDPCPGYPDWREQPLSSPPPSHPVWRNPRINDPGPGDAAGDSSSPASPGPDQSSEITWLAPLGDEPRSVETREQVDGRGSVMTVTLAPAPAPDWLDAQLEELFAWVRAQWAAAAA